MYILISDETNLKYKKDSFFVYGGTFFPLDYLVELDKNIETLREKYGYKKSDPLKFNSKSRPKDVSTKDFADLKNELIDLCIRKNCKFIVYVILHDIAKNKREAFRMKSGINHVIGRFNEFLRENNDYGICVMDRISGNGEYKIMEKLHTTGLDFDDSKGIELDRIKLYSSSTINASNIFSIADIILGSFRYCINDPQNIEAAETMMKKVFSLMWHKKIKGEIEVLGKGLILRPKDIKSKIYKIRYVELLDNIKKLIGS